MPETPFSDGTVGHGESALRGIPGRILALGDKEGLLVTITGPAGSGKSRAVRSLVASLPGWHAVRVAALSWESDVPSSLAQHVSQLTGQPSSSRRGLDVAGKSTALIIDDAHWADPESLRLLVQQVRRMHHGRLALILTLAEGQFAHSPTDLSSIRGIADIDLTIPPLSNREIQAFMQREAGVRLDPTTVTRLGALTGGRPGRIRDVIASVSPEHWRQSDPVIPVPQIWRGSFARRSADLSSAGRMALTVTATFDSDAPMPVVLRLIKEYGDQDGVAAVSEATDARLLELRFSGNRTYLGFCDPSDRAVLRAEQSLRSRADIHRRAAAMFRDQEDEQATLVHATLADALTGDPDTSALADFADDLAYRGLWLGSAHIYQLASEVEPHQPTAREFRLASTEALISASNIPAASMQASSLDRAQQTPRMDSMLGYLALHEGRRTETVGLLARATADLLPDGIPAEQVTPDPAVARLASRTMLLNLAEWNIPELVRWADLADQCSPESSGDWIESSAVALIGRSAFSGELPRDTVPHGESPVQAERRDMAMGWLSLVHDDPLTARQKLRTRTHLEGSERILLWKDAWLARTSLVLGDFQEAMSAVERGLDRADRFGIRFIEPLLLWSGAQIAHMQGNKSLTQQYHARLGVGSDSFAIQRIPAAMTRLLVAYNSGEFPTAVRAGQELLDLRETTDYTQAGFWPWEDVYAQVLMRMNLFDDADELITDAESIANTAGLVSLQAKLMVPRGNLLLHRGEAEKGIRCLEDAVDAITPLRMPFYESRILFEYGQILRRLGRRRKADEIFGRAAEIFAAMGAHHFVELCNRERRAGGLGPRTTQPGELTAQEQQIAEAVATGATNREVSTELYLSTKTVEYHLTRIFRKLRIRNRGELAQALAERSAG